MDASTGGVSCDKCDGNYKSNNITVYGNSIVVKQKGPKLAAKYNIKLLEIQTKIYHLSFLEK